MTFWAVLGGLIGLVIGVVAGLLLLLGIAPLIGYAFTLPGILGTIATTLAPGVGSLAIPWGVFLLLWMIAMIVLTAIFYVIAAVAIRPLPTVAGPVPFTAGERICFGIMIGINVGVNAVVWLSVPLPGAIIAAVLSLVGLLALIWQISIVLAYQVALGWISWLMPLSWPANIIGLPVAIGAAIAGRIAFGACVLTIDFETGSVEVAFIAPVGSPTGFSLGHFNFLVGPPGTALATLQASTAAQDIPAHEAGHSLNTGAFGSAFLVVNAIEENIFPPNGADAYGELCAESNARDTGRNFIELWDD